MTEQEKINSEVQLKLALQDQLKLALQDAKFAVFMEESKQRREDIRRLNEKIESKFDELSGQIQSLTIAAVVGIGAIVIGGGIGAIVIGGSTIIWSAISSLK